MNSLINAAKTAALMALLMFLGNSGQAASVQNLLHKFALTTPPGWTPVPKSSNMTKYVASSPDRTRSVAILVIPMGGMTEATMLEDVKKVWFQTGTGNGQVEKTTLARHTAYRLRHFAVIGGKKLHRTDTLVFNNDNLYQIDAMSRDSEPLNDPDIAECVASFKFIGETNNALTKQQSAVSKTSKPQRAPGNGLPEFIADITTYVLVGIVIVYVCIRVLKTKR